jgi:hypothetical protein
VTSVSSNLCAALTWYQTQNPLDESSVSEPETARSPVDEHIKLLHSCYIYSSGVDSLIHSSDVDSLVYNSDVDSLV